jgi:hydroxymethylglutaryl-CoA reductase (NADPH)
VKAAPGRREIDRLAAALAAGEIRMHQLPADLPADVAAEIRRLALERKGGGRLEHIGRYSLDGDRAASRHCENFIGVAQIPMGVAGPLVLQGAHVEGEVHVPLATTEGALVASVNRGCAAIRAAGGATVRAEDVGMTRGPVFRTGGVRDTERFLAWIRDNEPAIREAAEGTSRHLRLLDIRPYAFGTTVFLRFRFASGDAMGMNMATIACDRAVREVIEPKAGVPCVALSGNYCSDKKPSAINFHEGRGKRIHGEVRLGPEVLRDCLKTGAASLLEVQYRKILLGSVAAGSTGFNAHYANLVAAVFIATGQDVAHVAEGAVGITCVEPDGEGGVLASVYLPDVPLGTVGGGTALATQREALGLLGALPDPERPGHAALRLAEILGGIVLAGEISLLAALGSQDLTRAHERLARGLRT